MKNISFGSRPFVAQLGDIPTVIDRSEVDSYERQTFIEEIIECGIARRTKTLASSPITREFFATSRV